MKKSVSQPAKVSYFFGPGWNDLKNFFQTFWNLNKLEIKKRRDKFESGKGIMSFKDDFCCACSFLFDRICVHFFELAYR